MYKDILVSVDINDESSWKKALPVAVEYCRAFGSRLHVVTVMPDFGSSLVSQYFPADYEKKMLDDANKKLHALVAKAVPNDVSAQHIVALGTIYHEIIDAAQRVGADLIIMASHRPGLQDYLIGPNASKVVRHFDRSVLVVRD